MSRPYDDDTQIAREAVKDFAGALAHELNNVLTAIGGNLSLLAEEAACGDFSLLGAAQQAVEQAMALSERLEAYAGQLQLYPEAVDVDALLQAQPGVHGKFGAAPAFADREKLTLALDGLIGVAKRAECSGIGAETGGVSLTADNAFGLAPGTYARIVLSFVPSAERAPALARALHVPFASGRLSRGGAWNPASAAGFLTQSGGALVVRSERDGSVAFELYLPAAV